MKRLFCKECGEGHNHGIHYMHLESIAVVPEEKGGGLDRSSVSLMFSCEMCEAKTYHDYVFDKGQISLEEHCYR